MIFFFKDQTNSIVSIKLQQDVILISQKSLVANLLLAFISDDQHVLYDAREEDTITITNNLYIINSINVINNVNVLQTNGVTLQVYDYQLLCQFQNILDYSQTFILYVKNDCLSINPSDLVKISSWLNEQWSLILNSKEILKRFLFFKL
jgi:hypothetical protein